MRSLSADDILTVWEIGQDRHPVDRALALLVLACPETSWQALAALPVGRRDALVYSVREATFGNAMSARIACSACSTDLELALQASTLRVKQPDRAVDVLETDGFRLRFRLPDTRDLADLISSGEPLTALDRLLRRCVLEARRDEVAISTVDLPEAIVEQLSAAMAEQDPQAEVVLDLVCPGCGHAWQALVDIVTFVWQEISVEATRLLGDVHALASAYHWREADILAMTSRRRRAYLEMVTA
jgi:hypothetical protein